MAEVKNIWSLLSKKYPASEYALMAEVSDASGFNRSRSADFIAVNLWPSRGLAVIGIELKSFRSDWLSELKKPAKAENIFQYCDYFYLLTTDEHVANADEIPASWGWMCIQGNKIITKKEAPKLTAKELSRHFVCAMLKRANDKSKFVHIDELENRIKEEAQRENNSMVAENKLLKDEVDGYKKQLKEFEEESGVTIGWRGHSIKEVGKAVKLVNNGGMGDIKKELESLKTKAEMIAKKIDNVLKESNE